MNFETVLFGTAFLALAIISIPKSEKSAHDGAVASTETVIVSNTNQTPDAPLLISQRSADDKSVAKPDTAKDDIF